TWPTLSKLVVTGASAGGYGSVINYTEFRARWPMAESLLIDDSGPFLPRASTPQNLQDWFVSWGILDWLSGPCPDCAGEMSALYTAVSNRFPNDRMALLSSVWDKTIRGYYMLSASDFETALRLMAGAVLAPLPRFKYFFAAGETH